MSQYQAGPNNPRTNGFYESQHKMLTSELRVRVTRDSAPEWSNLLTELSFSNNIIPALTADNLLPFNLVFDRTPRLSVMGIFFPVLDHFLLLHTNKRYHQRHHDRLQGLQFRSLEVSKESKDRMRISHDHARTRVIKVKGSAPLKIGDILSICKPQQKLPKLTFQWTEPNYIVTSVSTATVTVRNLTDSQGGKLSKATRRLDTVVNRKMTSLYPVPTSFFIGAVVLKKFGDTWCKGKVDEVDTDEGEALWHVTYQDFDEEQLTLQELTQVIRYHPLLNTSGDLQVPAVGEFVWYARNQQPRLGQVVSVDPTVSRPIVVEIFEPQSNASSLTRARFRRATDEDTGDSVVDQLTLHQIQLRVSGLTPRGLLRPQDRRRLQRCLEI